MGEMCGNSEEYTIVEEDSRNEIGMNAFNARLNEIYPID